MKLKSARLVCLLLVGMGTVIVHAPTARAAGQSPAMIAHADPVYGCEFSYRQRGRGCRAVQVPPQAHIDSLGDDWACTRGFRRDGADCRRIVVPANAHLTESGCSCDRGYERYGEACRAVLAPLHAHLTYGAFGSGWECDRGFARRESACLKVAVPVNAHLKPSGDDWACNRGYGAVGGTSCVALLVPIYAHLDYSGAAWDCNPGYERRGASCVPLSIPPHGYATGSVTRSLPPPSPAFASNP
jgi:hypothetical protein